MKSHVWFKYGQGGETVEIIVRDVSGAKLESWRVETHDVGRLKQIYNSIKNKYNLNLFLTDKGKKDKDLGWLDLD